MDSITLDRRTAVAGAAALAASAALGAGISAAFADEQQATDADQHGTSAHEPQEAQETIECDVVIAGAGIAGLMAADHLAEQGFNVYLLEKGVSAAVSDWAQCGGPQRL